VVAVETCEGEIYAGCPPHWVPLMASGLCVHPALPRYNHHRANCSKTYCSRARRGNYVTCSTPLKHLRIFSLKDSLVNLQLNGYQKSHRTLHNAHVATLPCKTLMSAKQAMNDKLRRSVATYLRCNGVVNN